MFCLLVSFFLYLFPFFAPFLFFLIFLFKPSFKAPRWSNMYQSWNGQSHIHLCLYVWALEAFLSASAFKPSLWVWGDCSPCPGCRWGALCSGARVGLCAKAKSTSYSFSSRTVSYWNSPKWVLLALDFPCFLLRTFQVKHGGGTECCEAVVPPRLGQGWRLALFLALFLLLFPWGRKTRMPTFGEDLKYVTAICSLWGC